MSLFGEWYRVQNCQLVTDSDGHSYFEWSGNVTPYDLGYKILEDALSVELPGPALAGGPPLDPPAEDVIDFFAKYGPLGLWFYNLKHVWKHEGEPWEVILKDDSTPTYEDYWKRYHPAGRARKTPVETVEKVISAHYREPWNDIYEHLAVLRVAQMKWQEEKDLMYLHTSNIRFKLAKTKGTAGWSFHVSNLRDALHGLLAFDIAGGGEWRYCESCGRAYNTTKGKRPRPKYCEEKCYQKAARRCIDERRRDPIEKQKRAYRQRKNTRVAKGLISSTDADRICLTINRCSTDDDFEDLIETFPVMQTKKDVAAIEKRYGREKQTPGPKAAKKGEAGHGGTH